VRRQARGEHTRSSPGFQTIFPDFIKSSLLRYCAQHSRGPWPDLLIDRPGWGAGCEVRLRVKGRLSSPGLMVRAGLPSAPEMPCAPRQLRLVPIKRTKTRSADQSTRPLRSKNHSDPAKAGDTGTRIPIRAPARKLGFRSPAPRHHRHPAPTTNLPSTTMTQAPRTTTRQSPVVADNGRSLGAQF